MAESWAAPRALWPGKRASTPARSYQSSRGQSGSGLRLFRPGLASFAGPRLAVKAGRPGVSGQPPGRPANHHSGHSHAGSEGPVGRGWEPRGRARTALSLTADPGVASLDSRGIAGVGQALLLPRTLSRRRPRRLPCTRATHGGAGPLPRTTVRTFGGVNGKKVSTVFSL